MKVELFFVRTGLVKLTKLLVSINHERIKNDTILTLM